MDNKATVKKFIAAVLTLICSAAAVFLLTNLNLLIFVLTLGLPATIIIGLLLTVALGFASSRIAKLLKRKTGLRVRWFAICAYAPSFIAVPVYWMIYMKLSDLHLFTGFFAGLGEYVYGLSLTPTTAIYLVSGLFFCTVGRPKTIEGNLQ